MFSWISSKKDSFEKILFDLENKIKSQESKLSKILSQETFYLKSLNSLYSLFLIYLISTILISFFIKFSPVFVIFGILIPVLIEILKKITEFYYSARKQNLETSLEKLKLYQLEKVFFLVFRF